MTENRTGLTAARCSQAEASGTLSGVMSDLASITNEMPVPSERTEAVARMLDHLSAELASAAAMLRTTAG
jgi:hypothetical protein